MNASAEYREGDVRIQTDPMLVEAMSLGDMLIRGADRHPERPLLVLTDGEISYADSLERAITVARGLWGLGVRPGDHVGILIPNSFEFLDAFFATALLGCVGVPINARYRLTEIGYVVRNADLTAILTSDLIDDHVNFATVLHETFDQLKDDQDPRNLRLDDAPKLKQIVMLRGEGQAGMVGRSALDEVAPDIDRVVVEAQRHKVRLRDTAMILYTSGTTAHPKGCLLSHEALTRGGIARVKERLEPREHDVHWSSGPLFHIGSLQVFLGCIGLGGTYVTDVHFNAVAAFELIEREQVTAAWPWFPAVMQGLLDQDGFDPEGLPSLRSIMLTWPEPLLLHVQDVFPDSKLFAACGMTETGGSYAMTGIDDPKKVRAATGGLPLLGIEVKIVDPETGEEQPEGVAGEALVRGYCVMDGYYRDEAQTAEALDDDGWLHTKDLYKKTETGHLVFQGRLKDMLKVGGENVAAVEVESLLAAHPAVRIAEVVGAPDDRLDEVPVAFVELNDGQTIKQGELIEYCRGRIASFKVPRTVYVMRPDEWPMSATKINKVSLRLQVREAAGQKLSS